MRGVVMQIGGALVLVTGGLAAGWAIWSGGGPGAAADDAAAVAAPTLSDQALRNLGASIEPVELSEFVQTVRVQATVVDAPLNTRPVATALGGIVAELHVRPGSRVEPGDPLVTITRAPIPRPELRLTGTLLPAVSEDVHAAAAAYRNASTQVSIVERELERVQEFTKSGLDGGLPIIPRQREIDLEYDLARARQELANASHEIERHGLTTADVARTAGDPTIAANDRIWRRALASNGFWSEREDRILDALDADLRGVPWLVGALGELTAVGRSSDDLAEAVAEVPALRACFVDAVSLLLTGETVARVRALAESGELEPIVVIRAPAGPPDWDVDSITVQPGLTVEGGAELLVLHDARSMWLRVEPIGGEVAVVTRGFEAATPMSAVPLVPGSGPRLEGLVIDRLATRGGQHERGAVAFVIAGNAPLASTQETASRTWGLREGLQYVLDVPARRFDGRFVLPAGAVVQQGPERVVLVRDGDAFRAQPVHVEYENEEVAVIASDGALFPGDPVCVTGAFAVSLSLQGGGGIDPHAGHDH